MAWRDQLKTGASFRKVPFKTVDAETRVGRRTVSHEYPQRDLPYTEDLGRKARQYVVDAYVIGERYMLERDALIAALEAPGPGELVHPRWGVLFVAVLDVVSVREAQREGGLARFSITFVEHGNNTFPKPITDTALQVERAATTVDAAVAENFGQAHDVAGPGVVFEEALKGLQKDLDRQLRTVRQVTSTGDMARMVGLVAGVSDRLTALIRTPVVLAQQVISLGVQLTTSMGRPLQALAEFRAVFVANTRPTTATLTGSTRARLTGNSTARADLQRRLALGNQARVLVQLDGMTAQQGLQLRDGLLDQIDAELELTDPPAAVATALLGLRAAVVRDVSVRIELLGETSSFTPQAVLPALVLAHRIYQDASRADDLMARNAVRHPAFVPAKPLEVRA